MKTWHWIVGALGLLAGGGALYYFMNRKGKGLEPAIPKTLSQLYVWRQVEEQKVEDQECGAGRDRVLAITDILYPVPAAFGRFTYYVGVQSNSLYAVQDADAGGDTILQLFEKATGRAVYYRGLAGPPCPAQGGRLVGGGSAQPKGTFVEWVNATAGMAASDAVAMMTGADKAIGTSMKPVPNPPPKMITDAKAAGELAAGRKCRSTKAVLYTLTTEKGSLYARVEMTCGQSATAAGWQSRMWLKHRYPVLK